MNAIHYALSYIRRQINSEVLMLAFQKEANMVNSLDFVMEQKVIRDIVLLDIDLQSNVNRQIRLCDCKFSFVNESTLKVEIPSKITAGRRIMSVDAMISNNNYLERQGNLGNYNSLDKAVGDLFQSSMDEKPFDSTTKTIITGNNTALIFNATAIHDNTLLDVTIANDSNLNNLATHYYPYFGKLCYLAMGAYIYKELRMTLGEGFIYNGFNLSVITEIVGEFSDYSNMYNEERETVWSKLSVANDHQQMDDLISDMIGNGY